MNVHRFFLGLAGWQLVASGVWSLLDETPPAVTLIAAGVSLAIASLTGKRD